MKFLILILLITPLLFIPKKGDSSLQTILKGFLWFFLLILGWVYYIISISANYYIISTLFEIYNK